MKKESNPPPPNGLKRPPPPPAPPSKRVSGHERVVSVDSYNSDARDAERYRYIKRHMEWRRSGTLLDDDSHGFVGCRFPLLANFSCAAMLDHNIDKMMVSEKER